MFCNRGNYYKGYIAGLEKNILKNTTSHYSNFVNTCIALGTVSAAVFTYNNWQDSRYISRLDNIIDAYYEAFLPSITDGHIIDMYHTYSELINVDINKIAATTKLSENFPENTDFNKLKDYKVKIFTDEIFKNIKESTPNSNKLIASLEKIKPFLSNELKNDVDDFIVDTKLTKFYVYEAKLTPEIMPNLLDQIHLQHGNFIKLTDKIRSYLKI